MQWLPPFLFGLWAGVLADRLDRRSLVIAVDLMRAVVVLVLIGTIVTDTVSIAVVLVALFLLGTAEVFADNTAATLLPMIVRARRPGDRQLPAAGRASSRSTSWPGRRSVPRCSRPGRRARSSAQAS